MGVYRIYEKQTLPASLDEVWDFISSPRNLQDITPDSMGFKITNPHLPEKMYPGMMVGYKVSPILGIQITWLTEITQVKDKCYFVDEQRVGPYALWHHEHFIEPSENGIEMTDIVTYKLPLGFLGSLAHSLFVKKKLKGIFNYRTKVLEKRFGKA
jgi:ligand-binding SRPBCC domain-containing protein